MAPRPMPWFRFYVEAFHDPKVRDLAPATKWLWVAALGIARHSHLEGFLMVSERAAYTETQIADFASLKKREVVTGLDELERRGMLTWDTNLGCWEITNWLQRQYPSDRSNERSKKHRSSNGDATPMQRPIDGDATPPDTEAETDTEHSSGQKAEPFSDDFAAWWTEYPRKDGKQKAKAAYTARRRAGVDAERLLVAVRGYAAVVVGTERQFIKTPAVFLHGAEGPWSEVTPVVGFSPALDADDRAREPRRCPTCSNTGHIFVDGEFVECDHAALRESA